MDTIDNADCCGGGTDAGHAPWCKGKRAAREADMDIKKIALDVEGRELPTPYKQTFNCGGCDTKYEADVLQVVNMKCVVCGWFITHVTAPIPKGVSRD